MTDAIRDPVRRVDGATDTPRLAVCFTATCPQTGAASGFLYPRVETDAVNTFLEQMSGELDDQVHAVLIWDQAGYHTAEHLAVPSNISLIRLPPRRPELNPIETLWHYLREHYWSNRAYEDYDALRTAAIDTWQKVCADPARVKSICRVGCLGGQNQVGFV